MKHALFATLAFVALAACSQPAPTEAPPAEEAAVSYAPCESFAVIGPGQDACGIGLTAESGVTLDGAAMQGGAPLIVTSGVERKAASLMVYPSPGGRFVLIRGCEGAPENPGICWRTVVLDRQGAIWRDLTLRSHYGPSRDIFWAPDNGRFAVIEPMEGFEAVTLVNPVSGAIASFPPEGGVNNWKVDDSSVRWTSNTQVAVQAEVCNGDTGRCAAAAEQTLGAP